MRKRLRFITTFLVTFVVLASSGYGILVLSKDSRFTRKAESQKLAQTTPTPTETTSTIIPNNISTTPVADFGKPIRLSIPSQNINLPVLDGTYDDGEWSLSEDKAHFATMTKKPNEIEGNTLIYGHNNSKVFWRTKDLKPGDVLVIETEEGKVAEYSFSSFELVVPTDVSVFQYHGRPRVTLLTCNGWQDKYRKLMYFSLLSVKDKEV